MQRLSENQLISGTWTPSFYGYDGHASVRSLTDSNGSVTDSAEYDAFGNLIASTGSTQNSYLFSGEQFDPALSLYQMRARWYREATGRFVTRDREEGWLNNPITLHKYLYANGDPVNASDPSGRAAYAGTIQLYGRVSLSALVIRGLQAASAAVACALIWEGTKTHAEVVAGPFGKVVAVAPCVAMGIPDDDNWTLKGWLDWLLGPPFPGHMDRKPKDRCEEVQESCTAECWSELQGVPSSDKPGELRKCIRACMERNGCHNF